MSWLAPEWLWLLLAAPLAAALVLHAHARRRAAARRFVGEVVGPRLLPPLDRSRAIGRALLLGTGTALAALAAAGPSWGTREEVITTRGVDVVVALDVSRSMLSENETLTPLARAKASLERLVRENPGDRLGLVLFAGGAAQSCVLTSDAGFFLDALRGATPADAGRGGTRIGTALFAAHRVLEPRWFAVHRKLFELVSDAALVRANRDKLCALLGVPTSADLEQELLRLFDPRWLEEHERELAAVFGEEWSASDLEDEAELRFEGELGAEADARRGGKIVVLVTDGIDQGSMPKLAARILARRGVRLVVVGVGREGGGERPLVIGGQPQRTRDGQPILLEFASAPLRELAALGNGFYVGTDELLHLAERYRAEFPELEETRGRRLTLRRGIERYPFFLAPALLLLALYFATPAVGRARDARALLVLLGAALPGALGGCGDELSRGTREALQALEAGDAKRAEDLLRELQLAHPEDPRLAYDRALALQALGDRAGAQREARKARTGSRELAARAAFNQATLALDELREVLRRGEERRSPEALPAEERAAFEEGIARAQIAFEEARRLDPELAEAAQAERTVARWRAALRDAWRRADAAARRAALEQAEGVALVERLEATARELRALGEVDPLEAALRTRELLEALPLLDQRLGEEESLATEERAALAQRARELAPELEEAALALEQLEAMAASAAQDEIERGLAAIWTAWAELGAALQRLVTDGRGVVALPEATRAAASTGLAERTRTWTRRDAARTESLFGPAATTWIREELPRAEEALRAAAAENALAPLERAVQSFEAAALARELDSLEALPLLERLAREQEALPDALEAPGGEAERAVAAQERLARGVDIAREELQGAGAPSEGITPEELAARERAREALEAELLLAERAMRSALAQAPRSAEQRRAAREAAAALRETWSRLAAFEALLRHGIEATKRALTALERPRAAETAEDASIAIARLRTRLPLELERLRRAAEAPAADGAEDPDEARELARILGDADAEIGKARDSALQSLEALRATRVAEARQGFEDAAQRLERLEAELEDARKTLSERLEIALHRESIARAELHDAGESTEAEILAQALEEQRAAHAELEREGERLRRSLARELARRERAAELRRRAREAAPADPQAPLAAESPDDGPELRAEVEAAIAALELVRETLGTADPEVALRAIAEAHASLRAPWTRLAEFEPLVRAAIEEQRAVIERTRRLAPSERARAFARELQAEVRGQLAPIVRKAPPTPPTPPDPGAPAPSDPGSIARRNEPLAREAMQTAERALATPEPASALPFEEEALRLLEEILRADEQEGDQPQQQPQQGEEPPPDQQQDPSEPQSSARSEARPEAAPLSREEIERLLRLARERRPRETSAEQRQRSAVEEDH